MSGNRLEADLGGLTDRAFEDLLAVWRRHLPDRVPDHLPRSLLARVLAYRLQMERHGGLSRKTASYLKTIAGELRAGRDPDTPYVDQRQLKPGIQLAREHGGVLHRVMVTEGGYAWDGKTFESLSAVAKAITGTNWNGRRFFGLADRARPGGEATP